MKEDFILPDKWYIEITDNNRKILNDWKIKQEYNDSLFENLNYKYMFYSGPVWEAEAGMWMAVSYTLITLSQFKSHVLKETELIIKDNQEYLIKLLKEIKK